MPLRHVLLFTRYMQQYEADEIINNYNVITLANSGKSEEKEEYLKNMVDRGSFANSPERIKRINAAESVAERIERKKRERQCH